MGQVIFLSLAGQILSRIATPCKKGEPVVPFRPIRSYKATCINEGNDYFGKAYSDMAYGACGKIVRCLEEEAAGKIVMKMAIYVFRDFSQGGALTRGITFIGTLWYSRRKRRRGQNVRYFAFIFIRRASASGVVLAAVVRPIVLKRRRTIRHDLRWSVLSRIYGCQNGLVNLSRRKTTTQVVSRVPSRILIRRRRRQKRNVVRRFGLGRHAPLQGSTKNGADSHGFFGQTAFSFCITKPKVRPKMEKPNVRRH